MLKQRIITALVLVAILLSALLAEKAVYWTVFISVAILIAFYEWQRFCKLEKLLEQAIAYLAFFAFSALLLLGYVPLSLIVPVVCVLWVTLLAFTFFDAFAFFHTKWVKLLVGLLILPTAGFLIISFKSLENGVLWVVCFFICVVAADIGAYFSGKRFGKTKLAPSISPGKTVEGFVGGIALVALIFVPIMFSQFSASTAAALTLTAIVTAIVSVGGDLFESKLKRYVGLKDSSQILPGHGGVLDRVDSLMAGIPVFSLGLLLLGYL